MSRHEWYRNTTWNADISTAFELKLRRARGKEQYLRIQACTLKDTHPEVAHALLDRYFTLPNQFDAAQAWVDRADAYLAQGNVPEAIQAYEGALAREAAYPNLRTQAYIELPYLIATHGIPHLFNRARQILDEQKVRLMFPVDHFKWAATHALISLALSEVDATYQYAKTALQAAELDHSGFRYHPTAGLVPNSLAEVAERLKRICAA